MRLTAELWEKKKKEDNSTNDEDADDAADVIRFSREAPPFISDYSSLTNRLFFHSCAWELSDRKRVG